MPSPAQLQANRAKGLPDWYEPEASASATAQWDKIDPAPQSKPQPAPQNTASWDAIDPPPPPAQTPDWLVKMDAQRGSSADTPTPPADWGAAKNFLTGLLRIPGAVIGTPHTIAHTVDWAQAKVDNGMGALISAAGGTPLPQETGADVDKRSPVVSALPTPEGVDKRVFGTLGVTPYQPSSPLGQAGQAATTAGGAALLDPAADLALAKKAPNLLKGFFQYVRTMAPQVAKNAAAGGVAQGTQQLFPDTPGLAAAAALLTHGSASGLEAAAKGSGGVAADAVRQIARPTKQGEIEAGRTLTTVDNSAPGLVQPADADLLAARGDVRSATDAIGPGLPDHMAGAQLRAGLQSRADALKAQRSAIADKAFDGFREQSALPSAKLEPFMRSPSFRKALSGANGSVLDEGGEPLEQYWEFGDDGRSARLTGHAIPTDVLHRVQTQLGDAVKDAPSGSGVERTATILNNRFRDFLDQQYPADGKFPGYAAIRKGYADASVPLDPLSHGPVEKVLDADKSYGRSRYIMADEKIPDTFLRSSATRADLNQLTAAFGGDKGAATSALQEHLAGVAQKAVQPDGTLDAAAFDKAMQPYQKSLGNVSMWFPSLAKKFDTAKAAQATLDTVQAQRGLADAVSGGALRDGEGAVTGPSFAKWLTANKDALARTQSPAAVFRLQTIGAALRGTKPGELADVLKSEWAPTAIGMATGGLEGGVLGTLLHKSTQAAFGGLDAKRQAAFSAAIERATLDPDYAGRLAAAAAKRGGGSPLRALVRAIAATPIAVNAGRSN